MISPSRDWGEDLYYQVGTYEHMRYLQYPECLGRAVGKFDSIFHCASRLGMGMGMGMGMETKSRCV